MDAESLVLTVAIPAYNVENYIKRTVSSLLESKREQAVEIIIVDDGSTDATAEIADNFAKKYSCIRAVHQPNGGHGAAINTGIAQARGKYFKLLDGDDWVNPGEFARLVDLLGQAGEDLILCDYHEIYMAEGKKKRVTYDFPAGKTLSMDEWHTDRLISMHSHIFRTDLLKSLPCKIDTHSFYVDMEYILYPLPFVRSFRYEGLDVYQYRLDRSGQSVSAEGFRRHYAEDAKVLEALIDYARRYAAVPETMETEAVETKIAETTAEPEAAGMSEAVTYYMPQRIFDMYYRHILKSIRYFDNREIPVAKYLRAFDRKFRDGAPELYDFYRQIDSRKKSLSALQLRLLRMTGFRIWRLVRAGKVICEIWKK